MTPKELIEAGQWPASLAAVGLEPDSQSAVLTLIKARTEGWGALSAVAPNRRDIQEIPLWMKLTDGTHSLRVQAWYSGTSVRHDVGQVEDHNAADCTYPQSCTCGSYDDDDDDDTCYDCNYGQDYCLGHHIYH